MSDIKTVLEEMRDPVTCSVNREGRWADAIEAAMRKPVALIVKNQAGQIRLTTVDGDAFDLYDNLGTKLYALPPDAAGEIERLRADREQGGKDYCALADRYDEQHNEIERLRELVGTLRQQAQINAQEARTANASLHECYRAVSGGKGEPGNWNGANPVVAEIERLREALQKFLDNSSVQTNHPDECEFAEAALAGKEDK